MAAFDTILKASIGSTSFQLMDYSVRETAVTKEGLGRVGTKVVIQGDGWIEAADAAAFTAAIVAALGSFRVDGQNVTITGLGGGLEYQLLAASCVDGGPFVDVEIGQQSQRGEGFVKPVKFTANGSTAPGSGQQITDQWKVETATRPDGLRGITYSGETRGAGAVGLYVNGVLPDLLRQYPAAEWIHQQKYSSNRKQDLVEWQVSFIELVEPLPSTGDVTVADGEFTERKDRDEQMRLVRETSYDLVIEGDAYSLLTTLRPADGVILKESSEVTHYREQRLRASFVQLMGGDGNDLLNWEQTLEAESETTPLRVVLYPNAAPVFILEVQPSYLVQRGRAIGAGSYPVPPAPFWPDQLVERPKIITTPLNAVEMQVEWHYRFVFRSPPTTASFVARLSRPAQPAFN
jgi:hypothetical protein